MIAATVPDCGRREEQVAEARFFAGGIVRGKSVGRLTASLAPGVIEDRVGWVRFEWFLSGGEGIGVRICKGVCGWVGD